MHTVQDDEELRRLLNQVSADTLELIAHVRCGKAMLSTRPVNQSLRERLKRVRTATQERAAAIKQQAI